MAFQARLDHNPDVFRAAAHWLLAFTCRRGEPRMATSTTIHRCLLLTLLFAVSLLGAHSAVAQDDLKERAAQLKAKAAALAEQGRKAEAAQVEQALREFLKAGEQQAAQRKTKRARDDVADIDVAIHNLHAVLRKMADEEQRLAELDPDSADLEVLRDRRTALEKDLHKLLAERERRLTQGNDERSAAEEKERQEKVRQEKEGKLKGQKNLEEVAERLKHMRMAAEHLHAAGIHELAEQVAEKANAIEQELAKAKEQLLGDDKAVVEKAGRDEAIAGELKELHVAIQELRAELEALRAEIKQR
jgi:hypothetical protein